MLPECQGASNSLDSLSLTPFSSLFFPLIPYLISCFIPLPFSPSSCLSPFFHPWLWFLSLHFILCFVYRLSAFSSPCHSVFWIFFFPLSPLSPHLHTSPSPAIPSMSVLPFFFHLSLSSSLCPSRPSLSHQLPLPCSFSLCFPFPCDVSYPCSLSALLSSLIRLLAFSLRCLYDHWNNSQSHLLSIYFSTCCLFIFFNICSFPPSLVTDFCFLFLSSSCATFCLSQFLLSLSLSLPQYLFLIFALISPSQFPLPLHLSKCQKATSPTVGIINSFLVSNTETETRGAKEWGEVSVRRWWWDYADAAVFLCFSKKKKIFVNRVNRFKN